MDFLKKIAVLIEKGETLEKESDFLYKTANISMLSTVMISIEILLLFFSIYTRDIELSVVLFLSALLFIINIIHLYSQKKTKQNSIIFTGIYMVSLFSLIHITHFNINLLIWICLLPVIAHTLLSKGKANIATGITIIVILLFAFINTLEPKQAFYIIVSYTGSFLVAMAIAYTNRKEKEYTQLSLLEQEKENSEKADFIANMSRQIRGPLGNIAGISNILSEAKLDTIQKEFLKTIQTSIGSIANVLGELGDEEKFDIDIRNSEMHDFNLYNVLKNTITQIREKQPNCICNINVSDDVPPTITGVPSHLFKILDCLIAENLITLQDKNQSVTFDLNITVSDETDSLIMCLFELKSNSRVRLSHNITDLTYTNESGDKKPLKNLIDHLAGKIKKSTDSNGQFYSFTLSFRKNEKKGELQKDLPADAKNIEQINKNIDEIDLSTANVLLVEDNLINQKIMILSLKKIVKNIDVANNGREALDQIGKTIYDIILMDIQMPVLDGIKTTQKLRAIEESTNTHIPIIAITANALAGDRETCLKAGMDDYLSKPFKVDVLLHKMKAALLLKR